MRVRTFRQKASSIALSDTPDLRLLCGGLCGGLYEGVYNEVLSSSGVVSLCYDAFELGAPSGAKRPKGFQARPARPLPPLPSPSRSCASSARRGIASWDPPSGCQQDRTLSVSSLYGAEPAAGGCVRGA
jgi:hypothetical protein